MLSKQDLQDFTENGFLIIPDFADPTPLLQKSLFLLENADPPTSVFRTGDSDHVGDDYFLSSGDKVRYFYEPNAFKDGKLLFSRGESVNKIGHGLHIHEQVFREFSTSTKIKEMALELGFIDARILQSMLIFKMAKIGGQVPHHQDNSFIYTNPDSTIGFWFCLQDATLENGCMEFYPGSHKLPIAKRMVRSGKGGTEFIYNPLENFEFKESDFIKTPTRAGTLVLIHGSVYHKTAQNNSDKNRWIYTWHMIEGKFDYPKSNWLQTEQEFTRLL